MSSDSSPSPQDPSRDDREAGDVDDLDARNRKTTKYLMGIIIGSFIFAVASIPLYRMVCQAIDPGGSSSQNGQTEAYQDVEVDESREVVVQFATNVERQLPWELTSVESAVRVHPGEKKNASFTVRNIDTAHEITGKAVYDINPPEAGAYFKKVECFCFTEQTLGPGEEAEMPLVFWFDPDLPDHIRRITVAYTFFAADSSRERAQRRSKTAEVR